MRLRAIAGMALRPRQPRGDGFAAARLHPEAIGVSMDPFLQMDAFALSEPFFAPHPHAGFCANTYILPESPLGLINRDAMGACDEIRPGAYHWMTAGSGVEHEEIPARRGVATLGIQNFINLPRALKFTAPAWFRVEPDAAPVAAGNGATVRVLLGESNGVRSPYATPTPGVRFMDVTLEPDGRFEQLVDGRENLFFWVFAGSAQATTPLGDVNLPTWAFAGTAPGGELLRLRAGPAGARLIVAGGMPLDEPVAAYGPFVMSSRDELQRAFDAYRAGAMGRLEPTAFYPDGRPILRAA